MNKPSAVIVELDPERIELVLSRINRNAINIVAMLVDQGDKRDLAIGNQVIPAQPLTSIEDVIALNKELFWLLDGSARLDQLRQFLIENGVEENFIVDFNIRFNARWIDAVKQIGGKNFIITGDQSFVDGINPECFVGVDGINLADRDQDVCQMFFTTLYVIEHSPSVKFALLGLTPHVLFSKCTDNVQYIETLKNFTDPSEQGRLIKNIFKPVVDPEVEPSVGEDFSSTALTTWKDTVDELTVEQKADIFGPNLAGFEDIIKLCLGRGVKPIAVVLPYSSIIRQHYPKDQLVIFRQMLRQLAITHNGFSLLDLFDVPLGYDCFKDMLNLNRRGAQLISSLIAFKLHNQGVLPFDDLILMNYDKFFGLSALLVVDTYHKLMSRVFDVTIEKIRRQPKIKVGFVLFDAAMWCGDFLYRLFERSERYEPTVFLCLRRDLDDELTRKDFEDGLKIFASKNINVVDGDKSFDRQDVLIYLTPYSDILPPAFQLEEQTARTLAIYIPYGMHVSGNSHVPLQRYPIMTLAWKVFLDTQDTLDFYKNNCRLGLPRGEYSGYPRMDYFAVEHPDEQFKWKEARPRSTKIVWAPHWSIDNGIEYATFHLNYKFFYEYAKSHPKTSWVVKPHPNLSYEAVSSGLFRSTDEYEEYIRRWEKLPNARVITGGYYQAAFASSDGMILDSGSFNAEYQYTHKPLLFLTRDTQQFTDIGAALMEVLYRADGRDHKAIAAFIDNVLVKKKDTMSAARKKFFDEHFNYRQDNGMLASEYIFNAIDRDLNGGD